MKIEINEYQEVKCDGGSGMLRNCPFMSLYNLGEHCGNCPIIPMHQEMLDYDVYEILPKL